jgi:protease-4
MRLPTRRLKAIVLRVDSPGGSGLASDIIWHAVEAANQKKPVVVSMSDVAASGGYYISASAARSLRSHRQ